MNILALDLSSKSTGIAIGNEDKLIHYECVTSSKKNIVERIYIMRDKVSELLKEYEIDRVVIEEVRTDYQNAHTYKVLT